MRKDAAALGNLNCRQRRNDVIALGNLNCRRWGILIVVDHLFSVDQDVAETARRQGCPCGGRLHRADYPRKPRVGPQHTAGDLQDQIQLLLQSRRVQETSHTPIRAVPRPKDLPGRLRRFDQRPAARPNAATHR
jgi:hypothetical protein